MALKAYQPHLMLGQRPRIRRSMRLMARPAAFQLHRRMVERERSAFIAVAAEAARLIGGRSPSHYREPRGLPRPAMGIVAIGAVHGILGQLVPIRLLKRSPHAQMARSALLVDGGRSTHHQRMPVIAMHVVARNTRHSLFRVAVYNPSRVGLVVAMAREAR